MRLPGRRRAFLALVASLAPAAAFGWSSPTRIRMVDDAVRILPPALASVLSRHLEECRKGTLVEGSKAAEVAHDHAGDRRRKAAEELANVVSETIKAISSHKPMRVVCTNAGRISHLVADLDHPLQTGAETLGKTSVDYYNDFDRYAEGVVSRAPLVFYGWRDDLRAVEDVGPFALEIAGRSERNAASLRDAYYPSGRTGGMVSSSTFDDRSIPFAVASLSYSRAVSDTANLWLFIWNEAGGDLQGTPYREAPAAPFVYDNEALEKAVGKRK